MKELSIEEKAQRYDKLFVKAKQIYNNENDVLILHTIEDLIPELQESEDERIRKELLNHLKEASYGKTLVVNTLDYKRWADWLEKQGEHNPYGQRQECIDCQFNYAGECKGSCAMKRSEQKPAETEKGAKGNDGEIPNSAWSEEDENRVNRLIAYFEDKESFTAEDDIVYANWLKSLKGIVQPQKQEWSEKDKCMLNNVIDTLKPLSQTTHSGYAINSMIDWLKSLMPQNGWKPSDEQIEALKGVQEGVFRLGILESLYNDLMKLKE